MNILAIETSCDETAAAVVQDGRKIISEALYTQIEIHKEYGGVVPEIASRNHIKKLPVVVQEAVSLAGGFENIDAV
ncbi:MAG: tRNA (adenosine(37)-N6)-threonylcarbamoyltransferase complex transferase subunit TsaD, partial [Christensenellaceae bacterium]